MSSKVIDDYDKRFVKVEHFYEKEVLYGSIVMDVLIFALAMYFIAIKRWKRFEWTIVACMFIKYALYVFQTTDAWGEWIFPHYKLDILFYSLEYTLGPICHWIYAS